MFYGFGGVTMSLPKEINEIVNGSVGAMVIYLIIQFKDIIAAWVKRGPQDTRCNDKELSKEWPVCPAHEATVQLFTTGLSDIKSSIDRVFDTLATNVETAKRETDEVFTRLRQNELDIAIIKEKSRVPHKVREG